MSDVEILLAYAGQVVMMGDPIRSIRMNLSAGAGSQIPTITLHQNARYAGTPLTTRNDAEKKRGRVDARPG
jgi:hypothetical protein